MEDNLQHLRFVETTAAEITKKYSGFPLKSPVPYAYMELLMRVKAAAKGLIRLLDDPDDTEHEFCAALIIRTILLDFFISLRGVDIRDRAHKAGKSDEEAKCDLEDYFKSTLGGGLKLTATHFARMERCGLLTEEQLHHVLKGLTVRYADYLQPYDGKKTVKPLYPAAPRNDQLFESICENDDLKELVRQFDTYALYSKYEHFSIMSYDTFRRDVQEQANTIRDKVRVLVFHTFQIVSMLRFYIDDEFITEKHAEIGTYIPKAVFKMTDEEIEKHFFS